MKKLAVLGFIALALVAGQIFLLKSLDYSTASVDWIATAGKQDGHLPTPNFQVADLEWDVTSYSRAAELKFFRDYFLARCSGLKGIKAASCMSEDLVKNFVKGSPKSEIFDAGYAPEASFRRYLNGEPVYCTNFAGVTATALLSVGIPAKFVQLRPTGKGGHNIVEVWDEELGGWVLFDPFNDGAIVSGDKYISAFEAIEAENISRIEVNQAEKTNGYLEDYYTGVSPFNNAVVYPEPWLYTRVGEKESSLYRGSFVGFGKGYFKFSVLQTALRIGIVACLIFAAIVFALFVKNLFGSASKLRGIR